MPRVVSARLVIGSLSLAATAGVVALVAARRRRSAAARAEEGFPPIPPAPASPAWLRRFVTFRFNPIVERLRLVGGPRSPWAYIEHVGRRSGTVYRTPVLPRLAGDHVYVPLPYGVDVNWARNVRAAGHCRIQAQGATYELDEPAVITAAEHPDLPARFRPWLERRGNRYLRLHVLSTMPGTLADHAAVDVAETPAVLEGAPAPA